MAAPPAPLIRLNIYSEAPSLTSPPVSKQQFCKAISALKIQWAGHSERVAIQDIVEV